MRLKRTVMQAICECGMKSNQEFVRCLCPACHKEIVMIRSVVDFEEYRVVLDEALERIKQSIIKHGNWDNYTSKQISIAVSDEFTEYMDACVAKNIMGRHGQIDELVDVVVTAVKGIRRLQCLQ